MGTMNGDVGLVGKGFVGKIHVGEIGHAYRSLHHSNSHFQERHDEGT